MSGARIARQRQRIERLESQLAAASRRVAAAYPDDPGALSGIRRKPNRKADARRYAAYDREADLERRLAAARSVLATLEAVAAREARDAETKAALDLDALVPGSAVRTRTGWHRVVRVNAQSITVATPFSWTDRIPRTAVLAMRLPSTSGARP